MALDWGSAEGYTRVLSRDETSRLSTLPRDVVDTIFPYLHTYTFDGRPCRDGKNHGTCRYTYSGSVCICEMHDGEYHGATKWWRADSSMYAYYKYDMGCLLFGINWGDIIRVYDGECTHHDTLPDKYSWVWATMTQII